MDFVNEVSNDANGSKVPNNGKNLLFWVLGLLRFFLSPLTIFFGVDPVESEMKKALNWVKCGAQTAYSLIVFFCLKHG